MFNNEIEKKLWDLWVLRQENSTEKKDLRKLDEEYNEFLISLISDIRELDDEVPHIAADIIIMVLALFFWTYKPDGIFDFEMRMEQLESWVESQLDKAIEKWDN